MSVESFKARAAARSRLAAMLEAARWALAAGGGPREAYLAASVARWLGNNP